MLRWLMFGNLVAVLVFASAARGEDDKFRKVISPFMACQEMTLIDYLDYQKYPQDVQSMVRDQGSTKVQVLPPTGLSTLSWIEAAPRLSNQDKEADLDPIALLREVGKKVLQQMDVNIAKNRVALACFKRHPGYSGWAPPPLPPFSGEEFSSSESLIDKVDLSRVNCDKLLKALKAKIKRAQAAARIELAMAQGKDLLVPARILPYRTHENPKDVSEEEMQRRRERVAKMPLQDYTRDPSHFYQPKLSSISSALVPKDTPDLTPAETKKVLAEVRAFTSYYNMNLDVFDSRRKVYPYTPGKEAFHLNHKLKYYEQLYQAPALVYLGETNLEGDAGDEKIFKAIKQLNDNAWGVRSKVMKALKDAEESLKNYSLLYQTRKGKQSHASWEMIDFMIYQNVLEEMLRTNSRRCAIATGLSFQKENDRYWFMIGAGGAIIAGSVLVGVFAPPIAVMGAAFSSAQTAALLMGPPVGFGLVADTYFNYKLLEKGAFNVAVQDPGQDTPVTFDQVKAARAEWEFAPYLLPLDWIGTGVIGKFAFWAAARGVLKDAALSERILKNAASADPRIAGPARREVQLAVNKILIETFGSMPSASVQKLVATMLGRGFAGTTSAPSWNFIKLIGQKLKMLPPRERDQVAERAMVILNKLDPNKFNDLNRASAIELVASASRFGVSDVDQLVRALETWDQGVLALAKTYDLAATKVGKFSGPVEVRQEKAFDEALGDLLAQSPRYKALSEAERRSMRAQMLSCGLRGR